MLGYLSADIICSEWRTVFRERSSRKTESYEEQIMSKDKYPSIISPQMEAIVLIILGIFYATRAVLKIGEYPRIFPSFSWGIFAHVTRLDQSRASENIWWIIISDIPQFLLGSIRPRDALKAGIHMKAVLWLGIMFIMQISRLRFKQSRISLLISHIYVLGRFVNFWCCLGIFGDK